ncbi:MAG TPA: hypothetical protein VFK05_23390 [Polyangiaceae bacterium]|nr:hypothetical protein [Polyangiaceae bacterium]
MVDGRPLGATPRVVQLSPGLHTVLFVHPARGRVSVTVNVRPGRTTNAPANYRGDADGCAVILGLAGAARAARRVAQVQAWLSVAKRSGIGSKPAGSEDTLRRIRRPRARLDCRDFPDKVGIFHVRLWQTPGQTRGIVTSALSGDVGGHVARVQSRFGARLLSRYGALLWGLTLLAPTFYFTVYGALQFAADDYWHLLAAAGKPTYPGGPAAHHLFQFASGEPSEALKAMQEGSLAWYADPTVRIAFFRPLTALSHRFDYWLFGANALAARLHSVAWYIALGWFYARLLWRLAPKALRMVALFVFVCDAAHWQAVTWIAARNALVSATFACAALLCYVRGRDERRRELQLAALLLYCFSLAGGESAFGIVPYVLGYEASRSSETRKQRLLSVTPWLGLSLGVLVLYAALGYGTRHSGAYLNPLAEPAAFLADLPSRLCCMLSFSYVGLPADLWFLQPRLRVACAVAGVLALIGLALAFRFVRGELELAERRFTLWMGIAAFVALLPQAGGLLGARSLTLSSLGTSVVIAALLCALARRFTRDVGFSRALAGTSALLVFLIHFLLASATWLTSALFYNQALAKISAEATALRFDGAAPQKVILLQASDFFVVRYLPFQRRVLGLSTPSTWHGISQADHAHRLRRTGIDSFELEVLDGDMLETPLEHAVRPLEALLAVGQRVDLEDFSIRVLEVGKVGPHRIAVTCRAALEDPRWLFLVWKASRLQRFEFPRVGESVVLPWSPSPMTMSF